MFAPLYLRKLFADATMDVKDITHTKVLWQCYSIMIMYTALHSTSNDSSINMAPCSEFVLFFICYFTIIIVIPCSINH